MSSGIALPHWSDLVLWYLAFLMSIVAHESAHAWAALKLGDHTAHAEGLVTLDPVPHLRREPFGAVVVPLLSYVFGGWMIGWASTPYSRVWAQRAPKAAALMALAGPLANLGLVILAALLIRVGILFDYFRPPSKIGFSMVVTAPGGGVPEGLAMLLSILFTINLILLVFNLLPLPPMDGSAILPLVLSHDAALRYRNLVQNSSLSFLGLFLAWKFFGEVFSPLHLMAIKLLYPGLGYH